MNKLRILTLFAIFLAVTSCRDAKKEQQELDATLDKIEEVEQEIDQAIEELDQKAEEVESVLSELDNI